MSYTRKTDTDRFTREAPCINHVQGRFLSPVPRGENSERRKTRATETGDANMMQAAVYGRLGRDPQTRTTRNENQMTTTSIAVDVSPHNAETQETQWLAVLAFGKAAETLERHSKGDLVSLAGRVVLNRWTGSDGEEREQLQIIADSVVSARTVRPGGRRRQAQTDTAPFNDRVDI